MAELGQLEKLVKKRIKQAENRNLHHKVAVILGEFGHKASKYDRWGMSSEHNTSYRDGKLQVQKITVTSKNFDSYGEYGSSYSTWREVLFDGEKVYHEDECCRFGELSHLIRMYVPGEWEEWLKRPYVAASKIITKREKQKREREEKWRAEEEQRKINGLQRNFGLGGK